VFGLYSGLLLFLLLFYLLWLGSGFGGCLLGLFLLLGLLLFFWWGILETFFDHDGLVDNSLVDRLIGDGLVPSCRIGILGAPLGVEDELEPTGHEAGDKEISKGNALANKEGVDKEMLFKDMDRFEGLLQVVVYGFLVVRVAADQWAEVATEVRENFVIAIGHPAQDGGIVLLGLPEESGLFVL
jgi:hypothetical protein